MHTAVILGQIESGDPLQKKFKSASSPHDGKDHHAMLAPSPGIENPSCGWHSELDHGAQTL